MRAFFRVFFLLLAFLAIISVSSATTSFDANVRGEYFELEKEFPNFFLPPQHRGKDQKDIPPKVIEKSKQDLSKAVTSIFNRLTVPIFDGGKSKTVRYFELLGREAKKIDPKIRVMPSGGVVRSVLGYIYKEIYEGNKKGVSTTDTLKRLADSKKDIDSIDVRGVGSDFDMLVDNCDKQKCAEVQTAINKITNSLMGNSGGLEDGSLKNTVFVVGDILVYDDQISRSVSQGGSTIDFLAFDIKNGDFVEPPRQQGIVNSFISGVYEYIAPKKESDVKYKAKQTVRGMRPLLELPFLRIKDESRFREELTKILESLEKDDRLPQGALLQFDKMMRNARYSGAHNRFFRGGKGSIERLIKEVADKIGEKTGRRLIMEYADSFEIQGRKLSPNMKEIPDDVLIPMDDFIANHTDKGKVYHGTYSVESALSIIRGGFRISGGTQSQGFAAFGRGVYSTRDIETAKLFSSSMVFDLAVKQDQNIRILDWKKAEKNKKIQEIIEAAKDSKQPVFELLARKYQIDIIVNEHILIQNADAIQLEKNYVTILNGIKNRMLSLDIGEVKNMENHAKTYRYIYSLLSDDTKSKLDDPDKVYVLALNHIQNKIPSLYKANDVEGYVESYKFIYDLLSDDAKSKLDGPDEVSVLALNHIQNKISSIDDYYHIIDHAANYRHIYSRMSDDAKSKLDDPDKVSVFALKKIQNKISSLYDARDVSQYVKNYKFIYDLLSDDAKSKLDDPDKVSVLALNHIQNKISSIDDYDHIVQHIKNHIDIYDRMSDDAKSKLGDPDKLYKRILGKIQYVLHHYAFRDNYQMVLLKRYFNAYNRLSKQSKLKLLGNKEIIIKTFRKSFLRDLRVASRSYPDYIIKVFKDYNRFYNRLPDEIKGLLHIHDLYRWFVKELEKMVVNKEISQLDKDKILLDRSIQKIKEQVTEIDGIYHKIREKISCRGLRS